MDDQVNHKKLLYFAEETRRRRRARSSFLDFILYTFPNYEVNWHHKVIADYIGRFARNEINRLMLLMPPRTSKSEQASRRLPAFLLGTNPDEQIIACSYSASLAQRMNRDVQRIIDTHEYANLFPNTRIFDNNIRSSKHGTWLRNSDIFEIVNRKGYYRSTGIGGGITGMGFSCFPGNVNVLTDSGYRPILWIYDNYKKVRVLGYDHATGKTEWKKILATRKNIVKELIEVSTSCGHKVTATPNHRFFVCGCGYKPVETLRIGDRFKTLSMSYKTSQVENDIVSSIKRISCSEQSVYDIQVEGTNNFFAEGILVHNCGIIDDPVKNQEEALSQVYRDRQWEWYTSTFLTRMEKNAKILITMTPWHEDDLSQRILELERTNPETDRWTVVRFPALAEDGTMPEDPRKPGEPLWPNKFNLETLTRIRATLGSRQWSALYQQRPAPQEGGMFKRHWWRFYDILPVRFDEVIQSWDLAFTGGKDSAYTVGQIWGRIGADKYLVDQYRDKLDFVQTLDAIRSLSTKYPQAKAKIIEQAANAHAALSTLKGEIPGIILRKVDGSKENRAAAVSPEVEAGNIWLPRISAAPWIDDFINETATFPNSKYKDQVDAFTQAVLRLKSSASVTRVTPSSITRISPWTM